MADTVHEHQTFRSRSLPRWIQYTLRIPLELKLVGANLMIMLVAVVMLFGRFSFEPTLMTDAVIVVTALAAASAISFVLVRLALRPVKNLTRVAWLVSEGVLGARVSASILADRELVQLSTTINQLLDDVIAEQDEIRKLWAELAGRSRGTGRRVRGVDAIRRRHGTGR